MAVNRKAAGKTGKKGAAPAPDAVFLHIVDALHRDIVLEEGVPFGKTGGYRYGDVILLQEFAGHHGFRADVVERSVRRCGFFALEDITVKHGAVFTKDVRHRAIVGGAQRDLKRALRTSPGFVAAAASRSDGFLRKYRGALDEELEETLKGSVRFPMQLPYQRPAYGRDEILADAGLGEGVRSLAGGKGPSGPVDGARTGGRTRAGDPRGEEGGETGRGGRPPRESAASLMGRKLPSMKTFTFPDGTVAHKLETWMRSLAGAPEGEVKAMLLDGSMEEWLGRAGFDGLETAAGSLRRRLEAAGGSDAGAVKPRLFRRFRESGFGDAMFSAGAEPLLAKLSSGGGGEQEAMVEALILLGGRKAVEPLVEELFSSNPGTRRAVIKGLGELGDRRATPKLVKILEFSQDGEDKLAALDSLSKLDDPRAAEAIEKAAGAGGRVGDRARELLEDS